MESSFLTGDSDYGQNIWGLIHDPLTREEHSLEQRGKRTGNSTSAQAGREKSSVNPGSAVKQEDVWHKKSSVNPGPCCEAGRCLAQEKAFYLVRKLRGSHPPVLCCRPMCVCLCVFLALSICITASIVSCLVVLWRVVVYFLL